MDKKFYRLILITLAAPIVLIMSNNYYLYAVAQELPNDQKSLQDLISKSFDYVQKASVGQMASNTLLHGVTLMEGDFILLYDSTPFASKGHLAAVLPCNAKNPLDPIFNILVGRAPDLFVLPLGYLEQISKPPRTCVYHGQFGFGDPITDIALQFVGNGLGNETVTLEGPHSVVISTHEYYKPTTKSFLEQQMQNRTK